MCDNLNYFEDYSSKVRKQRNNISMRSQNKKSSQPRCRWGVATTLWINHWFRSFSLTFCIKFVS